MSRVFSGVQPTNIVHIGNYLGAIKNWVAMQKDNDCIFCVVDLHAITVYQDPKELTRNIYNIVKTYLALGIDPKKSIIFAQSHVPAHTELAWYLNTITKMGELERMTQFKDKSLRHPENINLGLLAYPVLMAADILLYGTEVVPVGEDQKQHMELARDIAMRFNHLYGDIFVVPEPVINKFGARIMGLDDPTKKMSKSAPTAANYISLLDSPEVVEKKIMRAVTDSGSEIVAEKDKPAITNLLDIYSAFSGKTVKDIENEYHGKGYGDFKRGLAEVVKTFIMEFQTKFNSISDREVEEVLLEGAKSANEMAEMKIRQVRQAIGLIIK